MFNFILKQEKISRGQPPSQSNTQGSMQYD